MSCITYATKFGLAYLQVKHIFFVFPGKITKNSYKIIESFFQSFHGKIILYENHPRIASLKSAELTILWIIYPDPERLY
jgi:hypothetical protein